METLPFLKSENFQGKAEVAVYTGKTMRYGHLRDARLVTVTVFEPFIKDELVKSESESDFYVLKQNQVLTFQTGVYPYRQMNSLFWSRDSGKLLKASMSTQEWCGTTYKEIRNRKSLLEFHYGSYWQGEGLGYELIDVPEYSAYHHLYDEMPLLARSSAIHDTEAKIFPMLMSSQVNRPDRDIYGISRKPAYRDATIKVVMDELLFNGNMRPVKKIILRRLPFAVNGQEVPEIVDTYVVDQNSSMHPLLRWESSDGSYFQLNTIDYIPYWQMHDPGDTLPGNRTLPQ